MKKFFKDFASNYLEQERKPERRFKSAISLLLVACAIILLYRNYFQNISHLSTAINFVFIGTLLLELFYISRAMKYTNSKTKGRYLLIASIVLICLSALIYTIIVYSNGWL